MNLVALLPADRNQQGTLELWDNGQFVKSWPCLAKADNAQAARSGNLDRNPVKPFGDTPTGKWKVTAGRVHVPESTYGPHPVFMLWPLDGQALKSHQAPYRRTGIWVHGGDLGAAGQLRPTFGCIRVANDTMAKLQALVRKRGPIETLETKEV